MGDQHQLDPIGTFYDVLTDLFGLDGRGVFGRLHTYGATREEPVALKPSTVRGWLKGRRVLPAPDQLAAMMEYFQKRRVLDEEDAPELRELWEAASRYRNEKRHVQRTAPARETEERREPPESPAACEDPGQQPGTRRKRRVERWVGIGGYAGAALALPALAMQLPWVSRREPAAPAAPAAHSSVAPKKVSPASETTSEQFSATVAEPSLCSIVIKKSARVYLAPDEKAEVVESRPLNTKVLVFDHPNPPGWRLVYTPKDSSQISWMRAATLTPPTSVSACQD
jgi:hypothetical protein